VETLIFVAMKKLKFSLKWSRFSKILEHFEQHEIFLLLTFIFVVKLTNHVKQSLTKYNDFTVYNYIFCI